jgi:hypothetical protein
MSDKFKVIQVSSTPSENDSQNNLGSSIGYPDLIPVVSNEHYRHNAEQPTIANWDPVVVEEYLDIDDYGYFACNHKDCMRPSHYCHSTLLLADY